MLSFLMLGVCLWLLSLICLRNVITKRVKTFCDLTILWFLNNRLAQGFGGFYPHSPIFKPPQFYAGKPVGAPAKRFPRPRYKRVLAAQARAGKKAFEGTLGGGSLKTVLFLPP